MCWNICSVIRMSSKGFLAGLLYKQEQPSNLACFVSNKQEFKMFIRTEISNRLLFFSYFLLDVCSILLTCPKKI